MQTFIPVWVAVIGTISILSGQWLQWYLSKRSDTIKNQKLDNITSLTDGTYQFAQQRIKRLEEEVAALKQAIVDQYISSNESMHLRLENEIKDIKQVMISQQPHEKGKPPSSIK